MKVNVNLNKPVSILGLYEKIAESAGVTPKVVEGYDCTKVSVSEDLYNLVKEWYKINKGYDYTLAFGMDWVCYGPKVNENLNSGEAEFTDDFMTVKGVE